MRLESSAAVRPEAYWRPRTGLAPLAIARARGGWVYTTDGRRFYEGSSGLLNLNIGHGHPAVAEAVAQQLATCAFAHPGTFDCPARDELAERLLEYLGLAEYSVLLIGSGTDAVECAAMLARQYYVERGEPQRSEIITRQMSYHGASESCLSRSGHLRRRRLYPFLGPLPAVPAPYCFRCPAGTVPGACDSECLLPLVRTVEHLGAERVAAVLVETIGGSAAAATAPVPGYYSKLRTICDSYGILLIADEVMCGMGRTGSAVAMHEWGCSPDILVIGKGLGSGYADISAVVVHDRVRAAVEAGSGMTPLTHTYGGHPVAVAAACAVLGVMAAEDILENVRAMSPVLWAGLRRLQHDHACLVDVRGRGFMVGVELASARGGASSTAVALAAGREHGVLLYPCNGFLPGEHGDAVFVAPPLNASSDDVAYVLEAFGHVVERVEHVC